MLLDIKNLEIGYRINRQLKYVVKDICISVLKGEQIGIIGESGSGKSLTAASIARLYQQSPSTIKGQIYYNGVNLLNLNEKEIAKYRGSEIAIIFQDAKSTLVPYLKIKDQLSEYRPFMMNSRKDKQIVDEACSILADMNFQRPLNELEKYPNQLSGGEAQRINVMLTILKKPKLLIADEPTSSLDSTNAEIVGRMISNICREKNIALIYISHNIGEVITLTDRIYTFYKGNVIEEVHLKGKKDDLFLHPYSRFLYEVFTGSAFKNMENSRRMNNKINESNDSCSYINQCQQYNQLSNDKKDICHKKQQLRKKKFTNDKVACHIALVN